jgi:hypothetical protein
MPPWHRLLIVGLVAFFVAFAVGAWANQQTTVTYHRQYVHLHRLVAD